MAVAGLVGRAETHSLGLGRLAPNSRDHPSPPAAASVLRDVLTVRRPPPRILLIPKKGTDPLAETVADKKSQKWGGGISTPSSCCCLLTQPSFSQFWALPRVAWGRCLTQETMSGQRVAAGGVCGLWRTPRASPNAGYNLGYSGHSCPAPPRGGAGRYHGHLQGHPGARQSSPCSPHLTGSPRQKGRWAPLGGRGCQALGLPVLSQSRSGRRRSSAAAGGADLALPSGVGPFGQHPVPLSSAPRVLASQDGAASVLGSSCPLGSRVLRPAPLAVVAVHSLPQA